MTKTRTEAFSDGVFAVAITLLIFNVTVPKVQEGQLHQALLDSWPLYATYAVSFLTIGIIWVNHHALFGYVSEVTRPLLFLNLVFLMTVAFIPFPTALLGTYISMPANSHWAAAAYSVTMTLMAVSIGAMWIYLVTHPHLFKQDVDPAYARAATPRFVAGTLVYAATTIVAIVNAYICLVVYALLALFYVFDQLSQAQPRTSAEEREIAR